MLSTATVAVLPGRDRFFIWGSVALITALAWSYLVHLDRQMSASMAYDVEMAAMGMTTDRGAIDLAYTFAMWTVMMVGMMAGSALPVLLLFAAAQRGRGGHAPITIAIFGSGYLAVWVAFSALAALTQEALHRAAVLSPMMAASSPRVAGAILVAAGIYQLTPFKGACLTHCRTPLGFLMSHWRDGSIGAFQMGSRHGLYCLGCCWALMVVLFAVGVMNLLWVAALTALVLVEKAVPFGGWIARVAGVAIVVFGAFVALA